MPGCARAAGGKPLLPAAFHPHQYGRSLLRRIALLFVLWAVRPVARLIMARAPRENRQACRHWSRYFFMPIGTRSIERYEEILQRWTAVKRNPTLLRHQ